MKFRVIQSDIFVDMVAALGANATPMPYGEVYSAIETGVIDGAENNFPSYDTAKHFEVAKNYSLDEHTILPEVFVMNKAAFDKLTPEDQAIFKQAAKDSVAKQRELWAAKVDESRKKVEAAGAQITTPDKQGFIDAMKPVYEKHVTDDVLKEMVAAHQGGAVTATWAARHSSAPPLAGERVDGRMIDARRRCRLAVARSVGGSARWRSGWPASASC